MLRRFARLAVALGGAGSSVLIMASPAAAHAVLVSSSPVDGAIVKQAPARVTATFDEPVGVSSDSLRVFSPGGQRVDTGGTGHGTRPSQITVRLDTGLGRGTYTVSWHVISADSHPVQGAFTFSIGAPSSTVVTQASLQPAGGLVSFIFGLARWLAFVCFAMLSGAITFLILCWPAGAARPAVLRLTMGAWAGLAASVLAAVLLQGVYGAGQGFGHLFWPGVLHATLHSRYGQALAARLLLVIVALFLFTITLASLPDAGRRERITAGVRWGVLTAALAATWSVAGHAGTGSQVALALPADIVHLVAMATWLGGLTMLVTIVLRRPRPPAPKAAKTAPKTARPAVKDGDRPMAATDAAAAVVRFSPLALGCVVTIVVTGSYMAWRDVGALGAFTATTYGLLVLLKIAGLCLLIGLGYLARRRISDGLQPPVTAVPAADLAAVGTASVKAGTAAPGRPAKAAAGSAGRVKASVAAPAPPVKAGATAPVHRGKSAPSRGGGAGPGDRAARGSANGSAGGTRNGNRHHRRERAETAVPDSAGRAPWPDTERMGVSLRKLRWSVAAETVIAATVLAVTAVLVNTPTARESYSPPVAATASFNTGASGGSGSISITVTPASVGPNQFRLVVTGRNGKPYRPQQIQAGLVMPARNIGPLPIRLARTGPGRYQGGPAVVSTSGQWQLRVIVRSDAFDEATVLLPFAVR